MAGALDEGDRTPTAPFHTVGISRNANRRRPTPLKEVEQDDVSTTNFGA